MRKKKERTIRLHPKRGTLTPKEWNEITKLLLKALEQYEQIKKQKTK